MSTKKKPALPNIELFLQMGLLPPAKAVAGNLSLLSALSAIRVMDEQNALMRFSWNLDFYAGIDQDLVERILYYRGTAALWFNKDLEKFMFTPYVGKGLDVYGRYTAITPLPFTGSTTAEDEGKPYIAGLELKPIYDLNVDTVTKKNAHEFCVIFYDYSRQLPQKIIPRQILNEPLCNIIAECIPFTRSAIVNNTGVTGYRVSGTDEVSKVDEANARVLDAALTGKRWVPIQNPIDSNELAQGGGYNVGDTLMVMEAFDNFRLSTHGIDNGGLFKKKSHMLESEQVMNSQDASSVINNCLWNRRNSCLLAQSVWGLPIWVDISQGMSMFDRDADGQIDTDQTNMAVEGQTSEEGGQNDDMDE